MPIEMFIAALTLGLMIGFGVGLFVANQFFTRSLMDEMEDAVDNSENLKDNLVDTPLQTPVSTPNKKIYIEYYQNSNGQWRFRIKRTGNHKNVGPQDSYHNEKDMKNTIDLYNVAIVKQVDPPQK